MRKNEQGRLEMYPMPEVQKCKLLLVGETVMMEEIQKGEYFQSRGGDVLRQTLEKFDLNPEDCGYTVAVPFIMNKSKTISEEVRVLHEQRLAQEIKDCEAEYVMPLGAIATQMVTGEKKVTMLKVLGNIIDAHGAKVIPNFHPAALNHNPGQFKVFQQVIEAVAKLCKGYQHDPGKTNYYVVENIEELYALIDEVSQYEFVAADIETNSLTTWNATIWNIGIALQKNKVAVIPHEIIYQYQEQIQELLDLDTRWIWHNGKYDISVLHWSGFNKARNDEDTILLHYCLNESDKHGLGHLATIYLGADEYKSKMNAEFANISELSDYQRYSGALHERVAVDADYTYQLFTILSKQVLANPDWTKLYHETLMPATRFFTKVQRRGAKVDVEYLKSRVPMYEQQIEEATQTIQDSAAEFWDPELYKQQTGAKSASEVFKPTSVKQLKWLIWDVLKLKPTIRCKRGATGADVLQSFVEPPQFILDILNLRKVKKEYSAFCQAYLNAVDSNDIVHCTFNIHTTATGRTSCTDPNLQQVPSSKPDVRRAFTGRTEDRIIVEIDYSGAELRVLAWISGDKNLEKAVTEGDLHSEVAAMIFGPDFTKVQRGYAKTVNFGIAYGRGAKDLAATFGYTEEECQRWIDSWGELYPDAWAYLLSCEEDVKAGRPLKTPYGRWRRMGLITQSSLKSLSNEAKNFRIQSISSDNTLRSAIEADEFLESKGALIINFIHDSILIDCPGDPETVQEVSQYLVNIMEGLPKKMYDCDVKFHCDVDLGVNWGEVKAYDIATKTVDIEGGIPYEQYYRKYVLKLEDN